MSGPPGDTPSATTAAASTPRNKETPSSTMYDPQAKRIHSDDGGIWMEAKRERPEEDLTTTTVAKEEQIDRADRLRKELDATMKQLEIAHRRLLKDHRQRVAENEALKVRSHDNNKKRKRSSLTKPDRGLLRTRIACEFTQQQLLDEPRHRTNQKPPPKKKRALLKSLPSDSPQDRP